MMLVVKSLMAPRFLLRVLFRMLVGKVLDGNQGCVESIEADARAVRDS